MGMNVHQMFPSKYLSAEDLRNYSPGITVVTIEAIDFATKQAGRGDAEIDYFIKFREFKKWARLKGIMADGIAAVLNAEDTDQWIGQTIGIFPVQILVPDANGKRKAVWVINVDLAKPQTLPQLPPNTDITGYGRGGPVFGLGAGAAKPLPGSSDTTPMGQDKAAAILAEIESRGQTWDSFVRYMRSMDKGDFVAGREPPECAMAAVEWARRFVRMFPRVKEPPTPAAIAAIKAKWAPPAGTTEVIDQHTGEVLQHGSPRTASPPASPAPAAQPQPAPGVNFRTHVRTPQSAPLPGTEYEPLPEDDIPF